MNVEIGTEAAQFPKMEHRNEILLQCRVKSTCKLTEKKVWKIENIWPGVDPNILATGGATTGYANTDRSVPRSNPGDLFSSTTIHYTSI
jgi:hypothetical protein